MFHPMMRRGTLQRRKILAFSMLLAILACASLPSISQASKKVRGPGYSTSVPNRWKIVKSTGNGWRYVRGFAPRTGKNGTSTLLTVGVSVTSAKNLAKQARVKTLPSSPEAILPLVANSLEGAQNAEITAPIRPTDLRGTPAAASAAQYGLGNIQVLQSNVAAVRHGRVYSIEMEVDLRLQYAGTKLLRSLLSHWRWR
jgi:hypothetical protein